MLNSASIRNVKFIKMRKLTMFITAVCVLFLIKLRCPPPKPGKSALGTRLRSLEETSFFFLFFYLIKLDPLILFRNLASISIILIIRFARKLPGCVYQFCIPRGVRAMPRRLQQPEDFRRTQLQRSNRCPGLSSASINVLKAKESGNERLPSWMNMADGRLQLDLKLSRGGVSFIREKYTFPF